MKKRLAIAVIAGTLIMGCAAATIASYLPIFETAVNGVIALVKPTWQADATKIETALNDLSGAVTTAQSEPTIAAKLNEVQTAAAQLETDMGVASNNDAKLALALLDLGIGTYEAILAKNAPPATATASAAFAPAAQSVKLQQPKASYPTSSGGFKRQANALCKQYGRPAMYKLTLAEKMHLR